ncbi:acetyltransferase [Streptomyces sp. ERV7]|uniref:arylamine N-acetyltransferase family protein n=1 Tax=Streptomyces sp. ERV7 TaxID=1322334 RepID=UPI0007F36056|nr:arylamine N-acetyltransferase [Streptomyces sp. ERV7]OAR26794.1 acetyltransferase [Streptomyces sp. ERV7]
MAEAANGRGWSGDQLDLDAYLARIGYEGERTPTLEVLRALQRAHVTSIPFENVNPVLGKPVALELETVQERLVRGGRGGYCYEHVVLFAGVLEHLGFEFTAVIGRVTLGSEKILPATHALLAVRPDDDDRLWLCDVGFGSGPLAPIEIADGVEADLEGWKFRMVRGESSLGVDQWWLYQYGQDGWAHRHTFTLTPQYRIDYAVGSHFVSTHSRSPFTGRLFTQKFTATHHHQLDGTTWRSFRPDGSATERKIEPAELGRVLAEEFGITVEAEELAQLEQGLASA